MEEFISLSSSTPGSTMGYDNYLTLLQSGCIRYDSTHTSKPSLASRAAYNMIYILTSMTTPTPQITPPQAPPMVALTCQLKEFYQVHTTNLNRPPSVSTITPRMHTPFPFYWHTHPQKVSWPRLPSCQHLQTPE